jgi:putative ABC transport system permease protein
MFSIDRWQEIYYTIRRNKLRTFLTAFSVSWGIFLLVVLLGAGTGLQNGVKYQFRDDAMNSIWIRPGQVSMPYKGMNTGRRIQLDNRDFDAIANQIEGVEHITARYYIQGEYTVRYKDKYSSFNVRGCHPAHRYLEKTIVTEGRFLNDIDLQERRKVTAIGTKVVEALFEEGVDPIGKWINVNGILYKVVGIYEDEGGENEVRNIYIPITTAQMVYGGGDRVNRIMFTVGDASVKEATAMAEQATNILSERHVFSPDDPRAIFVQNAVEFYQRFLNLFTGIKAFLWVVGIGTIVAGIVGVSNIMLIVAKERTREIGVRKALGATPDSIIGLFLQESIAITVLAGYVGLLFGVAIVELIRFGMASMPEQPEFFRNPEINLLTAIAATLLLVFSGALAGYFPARKAAKVNPIEALRDE